MMRDYESTLKQARTCAKRKYCNMGGNCEYYDAGVCCQGGEKDILNDAANAIEELVAKVPQWISVEERLPEEQNSVLVFINRPNKTKQITVDFLVGGHWSYSCITHWMPLPKAPELPEEVQDA